MVQSHGAGHAAKVEGITGLLDGCPWIDSGARAHGAHGHKLGHGIVLIDAVVSLSLAPGHGGIGRVKCFPGVGDSSPVTLEDGDTSAEELHGMAEGEFGLGPVA